MATIFKETQRGLSLIETGFSAITNVNGIENNLCTYNVRGGIMGVNKMIDMICVCHITTPLISIPSMTIKLKFGTATLTLIPTIILGTNISDKPFAIEIKIVNLSPTQQYVYAKVLSNSGIAIFSTLSSAVVTSDATWTIDTSIDQTLALTVQYGSVTTGGATSVINKIVQIDLS